MTMERRWLWDEEEWRPRYRMKDMFEEENRRYDKFIVAKAFADAYTMNDVSIIRPYITNPVICTHFKKEGAIEKEKFLQLLSERIDKLHQYGYSVKGTIVPTCVGSKWLSPDVLVKFGLPSMKCESFDGTALLRIETFLNCAYSIGIYETHLN